MSDPSDNSVRLPPRGRWFPEFLLLGQKRIRGQERILGLSSLVGLVAGLGAIVFYVATQAVEHYTMAQVAGYQPEPHPAGEAPLAWLPSAGPQLYPWLLVVIATLGGLASGVIVYTLAPETEGHGTDNVIAAYHRQEGYMRPRAPLVKIVASAITIGTGGSGGREGPIAQIGAGFGSVLAGLVGLRPPNGACCWRREWAQASARSFARLWPAHCSRPKSYIARRSSNRRSSCRRHWPAWSRTRRSPAHSAGILCSPCPI